MLNSQNKYKNFVPTSRRTYGVSCKEQKQDRSILALANDQLDEQILIHLLQSSTCTCFEQYLAHPQEIKLY
jgi:hypothetical protein